MKAKLVDNYDISDQGGEDVTIILTFPEAVPDRGNMFWGNRAMFRDSFFSNAYDDVIKDFAAKEGCECEIIQGYTPWKDPDQ